MSAILDQLNADIKAAMKAREKVKLEALRGIKKVVIEAQSAKGAGAELGEDEVLKIIIKLAKQGKDSAAVYIEQNRQDLADAELEQVAVFEAYLPAQLTDEELTDAVKAIIEKVGATSMKEMGKVMGIASKELSGKADGKLVSDKVKALLS